MTFREQVRWAQRRGIQLVLLGAVVYVCFALAGPGVSNQRADAFGGLFYFLGVVLLMLGGVMRPLQKWLYHRFVEPSNDYRLNMTLPGPLRLWVWIDKNGRDRDA